MSALSDLILSQGTYNRLVEENLIIDLPLSDMMNDWDDNAASVDQTGPQINCCSFSGEYNFRIIVPESTSRNGFMFSQKMNRLYTDMNKVVPIKFLWTGPSSLHVRAVMVYKEPDFEKVAVQRCRNHADERDSTNLGFDHTKDVLRHVLRCDDESAKYLENAHSKRHSVIRPLGQFPHGSDGVTVNYRFMCKSSCVGGINRNKTDLVFTLEDFNCQVVGRAVIGVKICSCPRRDMEKDETSPSKVGKKRSGATHAREQPNGDRQFHPGKKQRSFLVSVPEQKSDEFLSFFKTWRAGASMSEQDIESTAGDFIQEVP